MGATGGGRLVMVVVVEGSSGGDGETHSRGSRDGSLIGILQTGRRGHDTRLHK